MRFDPRAGVTRLITPAGSRRRRGRLEQEGLASDYGPVLDLSASGVRVISRRVPKGQVSLQLTGLGSVFDLKAHAVWSRKIGLFKYEIGFEFDDLSPEVARQLTTVATNNRYRRLAG